MHSFVRKTTGIINQGPNPPPVLRLSDGGHIENLGIGMQSTTTEGGVGGGQLLLKEGWEVVVVVNTTD